MPLSCIFGASFCLLDVGWCFQSKLDASIATKALAMAIDQRKTVLGPLVHSDRGMQFTIDAFQKQLADNKFVQSMSRIGDCLDNAAINRDLVQSPLKAFLFGVREPGQL